MLAQSVDPTWKPERRHVLTKDGEGTQRIG